MSAVKVWAFCNAKFVNGDQSWLVIAETGQLITGHWSSSREWGIHDVGPEWKKRDYEKALGEGFEVEFIVCEDMAGPPYYVIERSHNPIIGVTS